MPESIQCRFLYVHPETQEIEATTTEYFRFDPEEDRIDSDHPSRNNITQPAGVRISHQVLRDILSQHAVATGVTYEPKRLMVFEVNLDDTQVEKFTTLELSTSLQSQATWKQFVREYAIDGSLDTDGSSLPDLTFYKSLTMFHPFLSLTVIYGRPPPPPPDDITTQALPESESASASESASESESESDVESDFERNDATDGRGEVMADGETRSTQGFPELSTGISSTPDMSMYKRNVVGKSVRACRGGLTKRMMGQVALPSSASVVKTILKPALPLPPVVATVGGPTTDKPRIHRRTKKRVRFHF